MGKNLLVVQYNGSSKVFSTHIFVKDDYLAFYQRLGAMQEEIKNLYKQTANFQTGFNLDKTEPFKWFAQDIGKTVLIYLIN